MARRHLEPWEWGAAFKKLLEVLNVHTARGPKPEGANSGTVPEIAASLGVDESTARRRVRAADDYKDLEPAEKDAVRAGDTTIKKAKAEGKKATSVERLDAKAVADKAPARCQGLIAGPAESSYPAGMGRGGSRKGAGRKPGPAEAKRRNRLQINLTDAEYDGIRALAEDQAAPQTPAAYIRELVLRHLRRKR